MKIALLLVLMLFSGHASAETITGKIVNCRATPGGVVVDKLTGGQVVTIERREGGWLQVWRPAKESCWVSGQFVGRGNVAYSGPTSAGTISRSSVNSLRSSHNVRMSAYGGGSEVGPKPKKKQRSASVASAARGISSSVYCPCSSGNVCIGPRGGRYCITSGGNKRYGV